MPTIYLILSYAYVTFETVLLLLVSPPTSLCCATVTVATMPMSYYAARSPSFSYSVFNSKFFRVTSKSKKPPADPPPSPPPPRITSNVKQNLRLLKGFRQSKPASGQPKASTRYRRKRVQKEDPAQDDTHLFYQDPYFTPYRTDQLFQTGVPVMLVDGYNVCGYWPKLKKHFLSGSLDYARHELIDELISFSLSRDVKVVVVFDAMMSGLPTHRENFAGVDVVYSSESSADTWIEKEVVALKEDGCPKVWVVTSDSLQQLAAHGAGAFVWSCKTLISEVFQSPLVQKKALRFDTTCGMLIRTNFQGRLLKHNLDAKVVDALKDLRKKLAESESKGK